MQAVLFHDTWRNFTLRLRYHRLHIYLRTPNDNAMTSIIRRLLQIETR